MSRRLVVWPAGILALGTLAVGALAHITGSLGLNATATSESQPRVELANRTRVPAWQSAERLIHEAGGAVRIRWDGYLLVPESREYELRVISDAPVTLWIDSRIVFESSGSVDPPSRRTQLSSGPHLFGLAYGPVARATVLDVQWDRGNLYRLSTIPFTLMSARPLREWRWHLRSYVPSLALALCGAWSVAMLLAAWQGVWRLARRSLEVSPPLIVTLAALAALFVFGIWWGGVAGWAPDAIDPESVRRGALQGFAGGWHDKYPPLHYYLLSILYLPAMVADHLGWLTIHSGPAQLSLMLAGRLFTCIMAMATLTAVAALAATITDQRHAWPAALCAGVFLPFVFYAKTTNVDLPSVCWAAWSLWFLVRVWSGGTLADACGLGITAAAAVATKDQTYGLYAFPALMLIWRFGRTRKEWKVLAAGAASAALTFAVCYNVVFNPQGLPLHLEFISGRTSTLYRMFEVSALGQWHLLQSTAGQLFASLGAAGAILMLASAGSPYYRRSCPGFLLLAAAMLSYYLTFIAYAGYVYDRFLLPVTCILAPSAAIGLRRLLDGAVPLRLVGFVLTAWMVARAAAVDLLLVRDSRLAAESWLRAHVRRGEVVAAVDQFGQIPRLYDFKRAWLQPSREFTLLVSPDYVVVNREHTARAKPGTEEHAWITWLESGAGPYEEAFRYKASVAWTPLALDERFQDRQQDPFTNLDKINPEIVIFRRR